MKLKSFYSKLVNLPDEVKKATARAMFYAGFAMQSTEKQLLATSKDESAIQQMLGAQTALGQMFTGVTNAQTKFLQEKYSRILDVVSHYHVDLEMQVDSETGDYIISEAKHDLTKKHTKESYEEKLRTEWESRTDKTDDYHIEYGLLIKRTWLNPDECTSNDEIKKSFSSNFYLTSEKEVETDGCALDEVTEVIHVKDLDDTNTLKLIECYTTLNKLAMPYYFYKAEGGIEYLKSIDHLTLIKKSHHDDEIYVYKIKELKEIKEYKNSKIISNNILPKIIIKFIAENILKATE